MVQKNICNMAMSMLITVVSMILVSLGMMYLLQGVKIVNWKLMILIVIACLHMCYSMLILVACVGTYDMWRQFVGCIRVAYYVILVIVGILIALGLLFFVFLLCQRIQEMVLLCMVMDLYFMGCLLVVGGVYIGMSLPVTKLYDETEFNYSFMPVMHQPQQLQQMYAMPTMGA